MSSSESSSISSKNVSQRSKTPQQSNELKKSTAISMSTSEIRRRRHINSSKVAIGKAQNERTSTSTTKTSTLSEKKEKSQLKLEKDAKLGHCPWSLDEPLEACDIQGNWYPAKIVQIKDFQVKIHFLRWKKRYDQWFDMDTDLIRTRNEPQRKDSSGSKEVAKYEIGEQVLARWTDSKLYPAKIVAFLKGQYCQVLFSDGYKKKLKLNSIQKMPENYQGEQTPPSSATISETISSVAALPNTVESLDHLKNDSFCCDICKKEFRKKGLLMQHQKHFHKIELAIDEVPSLVPPQLRITSRHKETAAEVTNPSNAESSIKSKVKSENDSILETDSTNFSEISLPSMAKKRKSEMDYSSTTSEVKKMNPNESNNHVSVSNSTGMKTLTVIIPPKKSQKANNILLFRDARKVAEEHENDNIDEFVKCICPLGEESGLMVQCELCLTWQHGSCAGYQTENDVPKNGYFCQFCCQPEKGVKSQRTSYQLNYWLKNGQNPQFNASMFEPIMKMIDHENEQSALSNNVSMNENVFENSFFKEDSQSNSHAQTSWNLYSNNDRNIRKSFTLHDLTSHPSSQLSDSQSIMFGDEQSNNENNTLHDTSADMNNVNNALEKHERKSEYYFRDCLNDDDDNCEDYEDDWTQICTLNQLSAMLHDCMVNLNSLNCQIFKNKNETQYDISKIAEHQRMVKANMEMIQFKIDKIEKEMEQKDSYGIHTSSSTLSATSPENYGIANDIPFSTNSLTSCNSTSFATTKCTNNTHSLFSDHSIMIDNHSDNQTTLSSLMNITGTGLDESEMKQIDNGNNLSQSHLSIQTCQSSSNASCQPLARLILSHNVHDPMDNILGSHHNRPSMAHEYLPMNLTDAELKLEIAHHYTDLQNAKQIVLLGNK